MGGIGWTDGCSHAAESFLGQPHHSTQDNLKSGDLHPLLNIALFIVVFLEIHPFQDGNGRLSRILTTLLLLRSGYAYVPFSSLESVMD